MPHERPKGDGRGEGRRARPPNPGEKYRVAWLEEAAENRRLRAQLNHLMNVCPMGTLLTMDGETIYKGDNEWVTLTPEGRDG